MKSKHVIIQKSRITTSVYKNMIYRKLIEDIHVVVLRGTQMINLADLAILLTIELSLFKQDQINLHNISLN